MTFSEGALRLGVLYDLLGHYRHDLRDTTVAAFVARYGVDGAHSRQVAETARTFLLQLDPAAAEEKTWTERFRMERPSSTRSGCRWRIPVTTSTVPTFWPMPTCRVFPDGSGARRAWCWPIRGKLSRVGSLEPEPQWRNYPVLAPGCGGAPGP